MSLNSTLNGVLNRYALTVAGCDIPLDVEDFDGTEELSSLYRYRIRFTSAVRDIQPQQMLRKSGTFILRTLPEGVAGELPLPRAVKTVHGTITAFHRLTSSRDQVSYEVVLEPFLALLRQQYRSHRFFVNQSVPEVIAQILTEHGLEGWEFEFKLKKTYPKRAQITQYHESDWDFIQRLLAELGLFYFFTLQPDTHTEVLHIGDTQAALRFDDKSLPINSPAGMNDQGADSVWGLSVAAKVVAASVFTKDYNPQAAQNLLQSVPADMTRGDGDGIHYGEVYHYGSRHLERGDKIDPAPETANFWARLAHERFLAHQTQITGHSTDATLAPAQVLTLIDSSPPTLPEQLHRPLLITGVVFTGSRAQALQVALTAIPYSDMLCWRPQALPRPKITGTLTARITSAKAYDRYAWQDAAGLYRVKFDADGDDKIPGQDSMAVRLAKPYGGDKYGFHFPLIQGTEVAIAFVEGDPDKPYIAHALHDSRHVDHVTERNNTRNVIRTAGLNKLRMEDKQGEEHLKLSTEYGGKTQLNLGHNVNAARKLRGQGAELRTDEWVAVRGGKGILLSADAQPKAQGEMLDMTAAISQLEQALSIAKSLSVAAKQAKALPADTQSQHALNTALKALAKAGIVINAPDGVSVSSPQAVRIASGAASVGIMSQKNTDISALKDFTVAAGQAVSLFARKTGMKLFAAGGKLQLWAQNDAIEATAKQDITLTSVEGRIELAAETELVISCGGSYIKLAGGNIELGCPNNILLKSTNVQKMSKSDYRVPPVKPPRGFQGKFTLRCHTTNEPMPHIYYRLTTAEGEVYSGVTDASGHTMIVYTNMPDSIDIELTENQGE